MTEGDEQSTGDTGCSLEVNEELTVNRSLLGCSTYVRHRILPVTHGGGR